MSERRTVITFEDRMYDTFEVGFLFLAEKIMVPFAIVMLIPILAPFFLVGYLIKKYEAK